MISKVNINTNQNINKQNSPAFKGGIVDMGVNALQWVSTEPMYGVALIDGVTAIAPEPLLTQKQTDSPQLKPLEENPRA